MVDNFEVTLESFYEMRPDLGEKCKTRAQRLAEKQATQKVPDKPATQPPVAAAVPAPSTSMPISSSSVAPTGPSNPRPANEP